MDRAKFIQNRSALASLIVAGLGWGTSGLFVRLLAPHGLSSYDLLFLRLGATGFTIFAGWLAMSLFFPSRLSWPRDLKTIRTVSVVGFLMVFYYLGAITAFKNLTMAVASVIIGSSPILAWLIDSVLKRKLQPVFGVAIATVGLLVLVGSGFTNHLVTTSGPSSSAIFWGFLGAFAAAAITVLNARLIQNLAKLEPRSMPKTDSASLFSQALSVTTATVVFGLVISSCFVTDFSILAEVVFKNPWQVLGFGWLSTAIPGLGVAYASAKLPPQTVSTVSIQLQVWAVILGWVILSEALTAIQISGVVLAVVGSWLCTRLKKPQAA